ncbi:MAG: hypothetical protein WBE51_22105 [Xanthobacteraceae bacterium]
MNDLAEALKAERPGFIGRQRIEAPLGDKRGAPKRVFTMQGLRRLAVWGAAAASAVLVVVLASRSEVAAERFALILHHPKPAAAPVFDAQAATAQLAEAVQGLKANDEQLQSRLAAVEHDVDDVTGTITKQIQAAAASRHEDGPSLAATALASASIAPVDILPAPASAVLPATIKTEPEIAAPPPKTAFGVDIGSGLTLQALRMRWAAIRTAHPQFFESLEPIISVREVPHTNKIELRLVAGPIAQPGAAAQLCAQLAALGLYCQPTIYDGQHLALR